MKISSLGILTVLGLGLLAVPCWGATSETPQLILPIGHTAQVTSVAFSPDGRYVLSASGDNTLKLWEVATGREVRTFAGHIIMVVSVAFTDGRYALSGAETLKLWEVATGQEVRSFSGHTSSAASYPGHTSSATLYLPASRGSGSSVSAVMSVAFSPNGRYALSGSVDKTLKLWEVATGQEVRTFSGHTDRVTSVAFSPDGRYALSGSYDETLKLWEVATGQEVRTFSGHSFMNSVAFSPDGRYALSGIADSTLSLWEVATGQEVRTFSGHTDRVNAVAFSPDGRYALSGSDDETLKLWEVATGQEVRTFSGHTDRVNAVAFSPDGRYVLSGFQDALKLWEAVTGQEVRTFENTGRRGTALSVAFSPDGRYALSGCFDKTLKLWEVATGQKVRTFAGHTDEVLSVAFSPDGRYALSGSKDETLKLWEVATGQKVRTFAGHTSWVNSVAFSPDGRYALSGSYQTLKLWEVATGQEVRTFSGHTGTVTSVAFSPDGRYALSGSNTQTLKLWEVVTGQEVRTFSEHIGGVALVAFSPDGQYALSASGDELKLWEVTTGQEVRTFGHTDGASPVAFSPDGRYALSGSSDNTLKLWDVTTGELLFTRLHLDKEDWVVVTPDGRFDGSSAGMKLMHFAQNNQSISLDALFDRFYTPSLVAQVLSGEIKKAPTVDIRDGIALPPVVTITNPQAGQSFTTDTLEVVVQAVDQGGGVEDIRLYHNDKLVDTAQRGLKRVGEGTSEGANGQVRRFAVHLLAGENVFRASAFSRDRTESQPYELRVLLKAAEATASLYILAVGINEYKNATYNLNYARTDAEAVAAALQQQGQGIFKGIQVTRLLDREAIRSRFVAAMSAIQAQARSEDVFIFFYAGHGVMSEGETQPKDFYFALSEVTSLYGKEDQLAAEGVSAKELKEFCTAIQARKQLVLMDACQAGGVVETFAMRGADKEKAMAQLARSAGVVVVAATGTEQFAGEFKQLGHGVFTYAVLQGLQGGADGTPADRKVTVKELEAYLEDQVPELTKQYRGSAQYPNSFTRGQDFPLSLKLE